MILHLNTEKTQYMKVSRKLNSVLGIIETIKIGQYEFEKVEYFKYLDTLEEEPEERMSDRNSKGKQMFLCIRHATDL